MQLKLWPEAIKAYTQAIKLHVDYAEAYYNRGWLISFRATTLPVFPI